jgi:hypothetical protein
MASSASLLTFTGSRLALAAAILYCGERETQQTMLCSYFIGVTDSGF